jgi:hypothetical protein
MSEDSEERPGSFEGRGAPSWLEDINKEFGASSESSDFGTTHEVYGTSSQLAAGKGLAQAAIDDVFGSPTSPHVSPTKNVAPSLPPDSSFLIYLNSTLSQRTDLNSEDTKNESSSNDEAEYHHQFPKEREDFSYQQSDLESPWALPPKDSSSSSVPSKTFSTNSQDHPTPIQDAQTMSNFSVTAADRNGRLLIDSSEEGLIADYKQANALPAPSRVSPSKTIITPQEAVNSQYRSDIYDVKATGSEDQLLIQFSSTESKGFSSPKSCLSPANQTSPNNGSAKKLCFADCRATEDQQNTTSFEQTRSCSTQDQEKDDTSQLSGSQMDVDDLISRFTETKTSLDDLDDILGPMGSESFDRHAAAIAKTSSYSPKKAASSTLLMDTITEVPMQNGTTVEDTSTVFMANQNELRANRDNRNHPTQPSPSYRDSGRSGESLATMKWDKELARSLAAPPCPPPKLYSPADLASQQPPENPLDRIVASLEKNLPPMGPAKKHNKRRPPAINSMTSDSTTGTYSTGTGTGAGTFDSSSSETSPSDALGSALSKDSSSSFWASSRGTGTSRDASFASPGTADTGSLRSPGTTASRSPGGTTTSPSASTGRSSSPSTTIGSPSTLGNVTRSQDSLTMDGTGSSGANGTHPGDLSTQGDNSTLMGASMSASFGLRPMSTSLSDHHEAYAINSSTTSRSDQQEESSTIHYESSNTSAESEEPRLSHRQAAGQSGGGRLWELANKEAARSKSRDGPLTPEASKFAESLMARTRSRAEPDAVVSSSGSHDYQGKIQGPGLFCWMLLSRVCLDVFLIFVLTNSPLLYRIHRR